MKAHTCYDCYRASLVDEIESAAQLNENVTDKVLLKASELAKAVRSARVGNEVRL